MMEQAYKEHLLTHGCCLHDKVCTDALIIFAHLWRPAQKRPGQLAFEAVSGGLVARVTPTADDQWKWWIESRYTDAHLERESGARLQQPAATEHRIGIYTPTPGGASEPALGLAPNLLEAQHAAAVAMHTAIA